MEVRAGRDPVRVHARRARSRGISSPSPCRRSRTASTRSRRSRPPTAASIREGYDVIEHRDLETRYLYHEASSRVRGVDVKIAPGLKVGYIMGVGDDVPAGIAQLGAQVQLLGAQDLAAADLRPVRRDHDRDARLRRARRSPDLQPAAPRLREERRQPHRPLQHAGASSIPTSSRPIRVKLPRNAEEVSEEDSPVEILAPARPEFTTPNAITKADFDGWVEQRGSKFFSEWDKAYTPMIETHDQGQAPQKGGWLTAALRQGPLLVLRVCLPPAAAIRRSGRLSAAGEPVVAGEKGT